MTIFVLIFALFLLGACAVVSSPVPAGKGKGIVLFLLGVAFWAGAYIIVRTNQEVLKDFLSSDYAFSGALANQTMASFVVYGLGWYIFVSTSAKSEVRRAMLSAYERLGSDEPEEREVRVFRPWPGILVWIPTVLVLAAIWFVPVHFAGVDLEPTANPTITLTQTSTATPTKVPTWTPQLSNTPTATLEPTVTPTASPTMTSEPTATKVATSINPNMPPLVCGGRWLHQEPFMLASSRVMVEMCGDNKLFAFRDMNIDWEPIPTGSATLMSSEGLRLVFEVVDGEILVNGAPFAEWLESQGGR